MTNTYALSKTWRYLMIIPAVLFFLIMGLFLILAGDPGDMLFIALIFLIVVSAISSGVIYGALTSKIITSPEGIENLSFGIQVKAPWEKVEKIEFAPDGFVNLHFKEPVYINSVAKIFRILYPYDKVILLSPYTGDLATSDLLKDIAKHVPSSNAPAFVLQQKHSVKTYQEAGVIGLYYLGWFVIWFLFAIGLQKRFEEYLATLGLPNTNPVLTFIGLNLVMGLFINTMILLRRYNAKVVELDENSIAHMARTHYLSPLVVIVISIFVGMSLRMFLPSRLEIYVMFLLGAVSLPLSSAMEKLFFRDSTI